MKNNPEQFDINHLHEEALGIDKKASEMVKERKSASLQDAVDFLQLAEEQQIAVRESVAEKNVSTDELRNSTLSLLRQHQILPEKWGTGGAKTVDHLLKEILDGETVLEVEPSGELIRKLAIATIDVHYVDDASGKRFQLKESKQIFKDGQQRVRNLKMSLAEKLKANESPNEEMVARALQEELGISGDLQITPGETSEEMVESPSYPGLMTKTRIYRFSIKLNPDQYNPDGYSEHQIDKETYFVWKLLEK